MKRNMLMIVPRVEHENKRFGPLVGSKELVHLEFRMLTEEARKHTHLPTSTPEHDSVSNSSVEDMDTSKMNGQGLPQMPGLLYSDIQNNTYSGDHSPESPNSQGNSSDRGYIPSRKQREFIPENRKDQHYWEKRRKNNEAARRSREKRRMHDMVLEGRICELSEDNRSLRNELISLKKKFGLPLDKCFAATEDDSCDPHQTTDSHPGLGHVTTPSSMMVTKPHLAHVMSNTAGHEAVYTSPPPLLAVTGALPVPVQGMHYANGTPIPYYLSMPPSETSGMNPELERTNQESRDQKPSELPMACSDETSGNPYHSVFVKKEPEEESDQHTTSCMASGPRGPPQLSPENINRPVTSMNEQRPYLQPQICGMGSDSRPDSWAGSPSNSYSTDDQIDEPLELTVDKNADRRGEQQNQRSYQAERGGSRNSPSSSLPVKLRHKEFYCPVGSSPQYSSHHPFMDGLAQLSEIALAQANPLPLLKKNNQMASNDNDMNPLEHDSSPNSMDTKYLDPRYIERRRRNNEAARKCRENRKALTRLREAKSGYLENENSKLRNELDTLQEEMKQLRELLEKKRLEQGIKEPPNTES